MPDTGIKKIILL